MYGKVKIDDNLKKLIVDEIDRRIISPSISEKPMVLLIRKNNLIYDKDINKVKLAELIKEILVSCLYFSNVTAEQIVRLSLNNNIIIGIHDILNTPYTQFKLASLEVVLNTIYEKSIIELNPYDEVITKVNTYRTINLKTNNYGSV